MAILIGITNRNTMRQPDCWLFRSCSLSWSYIRSEDRCEMRRAWMKYTSPCLRGILVGNMVKFKQQREDNNCKITSIPCVSTWACGGWNGRVASRYGQNAVSIEYSCVKIEQRLEDNVKMAILCFCTKRFDGCFVINAFPHHFMVDRHGWDVDEHVSLLERRWVK
jgi:hypothetical protein